MQALAQSNFDEQLKVAQKEIEKIIKNPQPLLQQQHKHRSVTQQGNTNKSIDKTLQKSNLGNQSYLKSPYTVMEEDQQHLFKPFELNSTEKSLKKIELKQPTSPNGQIDAFFENFDKMVGINWNPKNISPYKRDKRGEYFVPSPDIKKQLYRNQSNNIKVRSITQPTTQFQHYKQSIALQQRYQTNPQVGGTHLHHEVKRSNNNYFSQNYPQKHILPSHQDKAQNDAYQNYLRQLNTKKNPTTTTTNIATQPTQQQNQNLRMMRTISMDEKGALGKAQKEFKIKLNSCNNNNGGCDKENSHPNTVKITSGKGQQLQQGKNLPPTYQTQTLSGITSLKPNNSYTNKYRIQKQGGSVVSIGARNNSQSRLNGAGSSNSNYYNHTLSTQGSFGNLPGKEQQGASMTRINGKIVGTGTGVQGYGYGYSQQGVGAGVGGKVSRTYISSQNQQKFGISNRDIISYESNSNINRIKYL